VSFGNGFFLPLTLNNTNIQEQFGRNFLIEEDVVLGTKVSMVNQDEYILLFSFTGEKCYPADYEVASYYASNHQDSLFTKKLVCTLPNKNGRKIILDREYSEIVGGRRECITIASNDHLLALLRHEFFIELSANTRFLQFDEKIRKEKR
jgi:arylamine N-acetyltransferase